MTDVVMPQMGESIVEGTLTKWMKKPGERVERDEPLFEISTDKVDTEIPSPAAGTLTEVLGVHMVGPHVTDLIAEACVALRLEATTEEIFRTIHAHPTLPETLMQAAEAVYGHAIDA